MAAQNQKPTAKKWKPFCRSQSVCRGWTWADTPLKRGNYNWPVPRETGSRSVFGPAAEKRGGDIGNPRISPNLIRDRKTSAARF